MNPRFLKVIFIFSVLSLLSGELFAAGYVRRVIVFGNQKTERKAIVNIMGIEKNEFVNNARLRKMKGNLIDCGLFRKVRVKYRKVSKNRIDIIVRVAEKTSFFIFPIFRAWSGRYSGGGILGESNLFGNNKKTLLLAEGGNKLNQFFFVYQDNALLDSDFTLGLRTIARWDIVPLYTGFRKDDEIKQKDVGATISQGYKWTEEITTKLMFDIRYLWYGSTTVIPVTTDNGLNFSIGFEFSYNSLRRNEALLKGTLLKTGFEIADERWGSDYNYSKIILELQHALQFLKFFNYRAEFNAKLGRELPFSEELTLGGTTMRGYSDRQFRGDALIRLVNEATFPIFSHKNFGIRGLVFYDMGMVYYEAQGIKGEDFNSGIGGGLRVYMKKIVMPLLGLDFGYGIDNKEFGVYFSLGLTR